MSVIAWDGYTLAADKRACMGTMVRTTTKAFLVRGALCAYAGDADAGEELLAWFMRGHAASDFPASQRDRDGWAGLLVVWSNGDIWKFERTPYPIKFTPQQFAIGSGRDFALAAMLCGKTAAEAVEIACQLDSGCGNGIDVLKHSV